MMVEVALASDCKQKWRCLVAKFTSVVEFASNAFGFHSLNMCVFFYPLLWIVYFQEKREKKQANLLLIQIGKESWMLLHWP